MNLLLEISNNALAVTATLTGIGLVFAALLIAKLISPKSYSVKKSEPYECGIPTRGKSMIQFKAGYYIFAILFLIFDVETVFLYPWSVVMRSLGPQGLLCIGIFMFVLIMGLAYAWRKGALQWK
ncbi:NADH-quinone oxidoreductase subunit A [Lepagella muris]|jgi:NADH-quinone oxidoreductase subunit A|uniref:NADH-quinone oxidoreductase subunit A n=1 Tax=Lepagella muris TaxID=3032870 RepID=A0AC61RC95_9BACT|nr:NADH-quinone oxidoreductase subunit A [Lepagella muris]ROT05572.1 NADH-quinone oxidoreductase subunit A [Muribaculaceae bacterium Isolate-037 (Harlan)]TGY78035.1 NADH-quinone oxidoreductase subunit A [Lepagella muris]THG51620.1 NADH-quinone oxidoreductase subunit A [Bacteroidales bacterium]TKC63250.1 NADH-quinone oxidoreductase subunit A [Bacteroidales bacterium]